MATATTKLIEFMPLVLHHVPHVPRATAERALRFAAIEFCERTRCWRHVISASLSAQNQALVAPTYAAIHEIEQATHNGNDLTPLAFTEIDPDDLTGLTSTGTPKYIAQISPNEVAIYPFAIGTLRMSVFLKPRAGSLYGTDAADTMHDAYNVVPEFMLTQHGETIAHGALARLLAIPNEAWSNPKLAGFYVNSFDDRCGRAQSTTFRGQQRAPLRTKPRWF